MDQLLGTVVAIPAIRPARCRGTGTNRPAAATTSWGPGARGSHTWTVPGLSWGVCACGDKNGDERITSFQQSFVSITDDGARINVALH